MAKDGRLDIRFGELLGEITRLAKADDRTPGDWVRVVVKQAVTKRNRADRRSAKAARPTAAPLGST